MVFTSQTSIEIVTAAYPKDIQLRYLEFKYLIQKVAEKSKGVKTLEESLKWNEPSFRSNIGSPVRFGWNSKIADHFGIYFVCTTSLIETFKQLYSDIFTFDGNRALIFTANESLQIEAIDHCLELALRYKIVRNLPLLGA